MQSVHTRMNSSLIPPKKSWIRLWALYNTPRYTRCNTVMLPGGGAVADKPALVNADAAGAFMYLLRSFSIFCMTFSCCTQVSSSLFAFLCLSCKRRIVSSKSFLEGALVRYCFSLSFACKKGKLSLICSSFSSSTRNKYVGHFFLGEIGR